MFTTEERTEERVDAYVAALEEERRGYEARLAAVEKGFQDNRGLTAEHLKSRIADVESSIKWAKTKPKKDDAKS